MAMSVAPMIALGEARSPKRATSCEQPDPNEEMTGAGSSGRCSSWPKAQGRELIWVDEERDGLQVLELLTPQGADEDVGMLGAVRARRSTQARISWREALSPSPSTRKVTSSS